MSDQLPLGARMRDPDPAVRRAAALEIQKRRVYRSTPSSDAPGTPGAQVPPAVQGAAPAVEPDAPNAPAPVAAPSSALALDGARRRELAERALVVLLRQLRATSRQPVMAGGKVVDYILVPDNPARFKAADRILKLVAADVPADRTPSSPVIIIQAPTWMAQPPAEVIEVSADEVKPLALPA